jgi:hypothetical protein
MRRTSNPIPSSKTSLRFPITLALICVALVLCIYVAMLIPRGLTIYDSIKIVQPAPMHNQGVIQGELGQFDPLFGYSLLPNSSGVWLVAKGEPVPFHNDANGIRAPITTADKQTDKQGGLIFFGDSFTYGQLLHYQQTFAFLTAKKLGETSVNAGVPSYSLVQMLMYARQIIPKRHPGYVIVQYSPWLVLRAEAGVAMDKAGMVMAPYFYQSNDRMQVAPVPFVPPHQIMEREQKYKTTPKGFWDAVSFFTTVGIPFYVHHMYHLAIFRTKQLLGLAPRKSTDTIAIIKYTYQAFDDLAKTHHAKLVILALGTAAPLHVPTDLFPKDALLVNGWKAMVDKLNPPTSNNYIRQYYHWRGNPPIPVDWHPNAKADAITANAIVSAIRQHQTLRKESGQTPAECALIPSKKSLIPAQPRMLDAVTLPVFREKWLNQGLCHEAWGGI